VTPWPRLGTLFFGAGLLCAGTTVAATHDVAGHAQPAATHAAPGGHANHTPGPEFDETAALATSQAAIGRLLADYTLRDRTGQSVRLADYRGKPLVISLIYTSCYHICPATTQHLAKVVKAARAALGENSFRVVTIGFDTAHDNPEAMRAFARQQGVDLADWKFLSTDAASMERLARNIGFLYFPSPKGFDHLVQATVVDANGKIYRQVYGMTFDTPLLVEPLKELVFGQAPNQSLLSGLWGKVKLFCTTYDPANDRYRFDYSLFIGMFIGFLIIASGVYFLVREIRRSRRSRAG
jgi:protein SCO1/2